MRMNGRTIVILGVLLLPALFFSDGIAATAGDAAREAIEPYQEQTAETFIDPELEYILAEKDRSRYEFLSRLTPEEQQELARIIKNRLDEEVGVVSSLMGVISRFVPAIISAKFAPHLEPATVARISDKVSVGKAIAIAKRQEPEFLARVAVYQDPEKVTAIVEGLPEPLLVDITRILIHNREYRVVAGFSDGMSPEKLRNVTIRLDDPESLLQIIRHIHNRDRIIETAVLLPDDYLFQFMGLVSTREDYETAAAIGQAMDLDRQVDMLNRLRPEQAARLTAYYPPEQIVGLMERIDDERLDDIARVLIDQEEFPLMAAIADNVGIERLKMMTGLINDPAGLIRIARHMEDQDGIVETAAMLSDDYLLEFLGLISSREDYELAAAVGRSLDLERQADMLHRLRPEQAARLTTHYPPDLIARLLEQADEEKLDEIARRLSPEALGHVYGELAPRILNRFIHSFSREQILAALPHVDLTKLKVAWPDLTPATRDRLIKIGGSYPPLAETIASIGNESNPD